ncbi:MAG: protein-glutamate O-methyltransferase CheR [Rhodospirillaceae bacterium]|nr:MAG: protein-glutamate O-methyltransferase CheR [Rhodospirillaceae bacterium]
MESQDFIFLAGLLKTQSGLALTMDKTYLLNSRLQPVAEQYGLKTISELIARMRATLTPQLRQDVVEAMTTNETSFFRDVKPFEHLKDHVLPELLERRKQRRQLRILCAAASSGQEPYSIAMLMAEQSARLAGWNVEILGIDLDTRILKRAEEGVYSQFEVQRGLPVQMMVKYFDERPNQTWAIKPQIRKMVRYRQCNLLHPFADLGQFDIIFCRNVLIYFDHPTKRDVLDRLDGQLARDGFLFLGGAETVIDVTQRFVSSLHRGAYTPRPATETVRAVA